ncbi:MAG: hypothetical protein QOJ10_2156, partial [Chloroflexota bacterium]|nr:hypothetical protein [Chloroflexota bacterium]
TADLLSMNAQAELQHMDADVVAKTWLQQHNYSS